MASHDDSEAAELSARVERLLGEVRASVSPHAWQRVDELIGALVQLYGEALGRMLARVPAAQHGALAADELIGGLLALHALHPVAVEARLGEALERVAPQLGRVELVALEAGVAQLRAVDAPALAGARELLERVVQEAAPELAGVTVAGLREPERPGAPGAPGATGALVQIDLVRSRARASGA
jgi:hypothetical protein